MIRLNDRDSATLAMIAQYQKLPAQRRQALVDRLSPIAKPIGSILIGDEPPGTSDEVRTIAKRFSEWTAKNRSRNSRNIRRAVSVPKTNGALAASD
jgi:hypothetical protein